MGVPKPPSPADDNGAVPKTSLAASSEETPPCDASRLPKNTQEEGKKEELRSKSPLHPIMLESFVLLRTFPSGSCWKTIAKFHLRRLSPGPSHLALCCFNAIATLPSCRLLCLLSHHVIFNGYHNYTGFICLLWLGEGKEPAAGKVAVRWLFTSTACAACPLCKEQRFQRGKREENGERRGTWCPS